MCYCTMQEHSNQMKKVQFFLLVLFSDCSFMKLFHDMKFSQWDYQRLSEKWMKIYLRLVSYVIFCLFLNMCLLWNAGQAPLAAFGWVIATHLSLYPAILIIPVCLSFCLILCLMETENPSNNTCTCFFKFPINEIIIFYIIHFCSR